MTTAHLRTMEFRLNGVPHAARIKPHQRRKIAKMLLGYSMPAAANKPFATGVSRKWTNASATSDFDNRTAA
jgi:hypothetical protein